MNVLLAMRQGEILTEVQSNLSAAHSLSIVQGKEAVLKMMSEHSYDAVVLDAVWFQDIYPWEWVGTIREWQTDASIVVIPDDAVYDSLWLEVLHRIANDSGIRIAPLQAAAGELCSIINGSELTGISKQGIIAAVWPAASKDGATTVAVNTALTLARCSTLRVGLFDLNLKNPEIRAQLHSLTERERTNGPLRPKLQTGTLTPSELWEACIPYRSAPRLRILPGTHRRDTAGDVTAGMVRNLLEVGRAAFDITIADVSAYPDNAATVCAVKEADERWLVSQPGFTSNRFSWSEWYECYWKFTGLRPGDISFIMNRSGSNGERAERIASALGMKLAGILPNAEGGAGLKSVEEGIPLCEMPGAEGFAEQIYHLASRLSIRAGAPLAAHRGNRRGRLLSLLSAIFP